VKSVDNIKREDFHLLVIDCDIFETIESIQFFLSKIRKKIHETPALLVVRVTILADIKMDWFFDDFIVYPFRKGELFSRIRRLLQDKGIDEDIIVIGPYKMNLKEYSVYSGTEKLELTYKEFELLRILVQNRGIVFTRKDLLNKIWGIEYIGGTRTVDVHIRRLRNKLGDEFNSIIETVRNVGYRCI
jgi:DNA-binding response OmpR family regulator